LKPKEIKIEEEQMQYVVYLYGGGPICDFMSWPFNLRCPSRPESGTVALHKDATESCSENEGELMLRHEGKITKLILGFFYKLNNINYE